jgi:ubiquinone biosynthesis protein COQ9
MEQQELQRQIMASALDEIDLEGWTLDALMRGVENAGLNKSDIHHAFPRGVADALKFYSQALDFQLIEQLEDADLSEMKIREKIAHAVKARLALIEPHKRAERAALKHYYNPVHAPAGLKSLYKTVDAMWYMAGDTSTDFNFYTKRLTLGGVYASTLKYWLDDESEGYENSWMFLDRRIEGVMKIEKCKKSIKGKFDGFSFFKKKQNNF